MIPFHPNNPFPLLPEKDHPYQEAQEHSAKVDTWLGLRTEEIEETLESNLQGGLPNQELWIGLPVQRLLTPYTEIRSILSRLDPQPGEKVVDLGAGYGRMGFVIGKEYPRVQFVGYEYVVHRVSEGNRCLAKWGYSNVKLEVADLASSDFTPVSSEFYFLYDYGSRAAIEKTLQDLRAIAQSRAIKVVGRGRSSRDAIERSHPWLSQVNPPEHYDHYSIYRSHGG